MKCESHTPQQKLSLLTETRRRKRASLSNAGFSLSLSEKATKPGLLPAAARSPVSRKFNLPVRESIVMMRTSSPHKCTRRACDEPVTQVWINVNLRRLREPYHQG